MSEITKNTGGYFAGRTLVSQSSEIGGSRHCLVKLQGIANDLVFPTLGGQIANPFKGNAKIYCADLIEYRTNENGLKPVIYLLKTYKVVSASGTTINIERNPYRHIPFVGDVLMIAPEVIGGAGEALNVKYVNKKVVDGKDVWAVTLTKTPTTIPEVGAILTEADSDGNMLVKDINAAAPCDYDFSYSAAAEYGDEDDFESARYFMTPALGIRAYINLMSPLPQCVLDLNEAKVNGWFERHGVIV
jgi:pSer/pThr/pTyr-binding forkhead associated (FHA) protein